MTTSVEALMQRLDERTTERDYHIRVADKLADRIVVLEALLPAMDFPAGATGVGWGRVIQREQNLSTRIKVLEAALRTAIDELSQGTTDQRDCAIKIARAASVTTEKSE